MEHIVLEYDENTRTALVVATSGGREPVLSGHASPYIVADGYDFDPLCVYIPAPSDSVREQERDISPYLRQIAQRCQRISHPIDPPETAAAAARATFGGAAARPAYRGHKNQ